jgi:hypothetical protein
MTDDRQVDRVEAALDRVDEAKRSSLRKIVLGTAFAAPVVASFAINGMMVTPAMALPASNSTRPS